MRDISHAPAAVPESTADFWTVRRTQIYRLRRDEYPTADSALDGSSSTLILNEPDETTIVAFGGPPWSLVRDLLRATRDASESGVGDAVLEALVAEIARDRANAGSRDIVAELRAIMEVLSDTAGVLEDLQDAGDVGALCRADENVYACARRALA